MKAASALKQETDWEAMQKKATKKDARYGKLTADEYKTEALRQSAHYKKTGKWDAMGVYNTKGEKKVVKAETTTGGDETTTTKTKKKRDSIIGDENKDGNMLTRWLTKQRAKQKERNVVTGARKDKEEKDKEEKLLDGLMKI